jgi:hypothetical protein
MGVPYTKKNFDFNGDTNLTFTETDNYFTRVSQKRKNYLRL